MLRFLVILGMTAIAWMLVLCGCSKKQAETPSPDRAAMQVSSENTQPASAKCTSMYDVCPLTFVPGSNKPSPDILKSANVEEMEKQLINYIRSMDIEPIRSLRTAAENGTIADKEAYAVRVMYESMEHHYMKNLDIQAAANIILAKDMPESAEAGFLHAVLTAAKDEDESNAPKYIEPALKKAISEKHGKLLAEMLEYDPAFDKADEIYTNLREIYKDGVSKKDPESMYRLAAAIELYNLAKGERTAKTPYSGELLQLMTDAANAGQRDAMMRLGVNMAKDEATWDSAFVWLKKAADKGEETALSVIFYLYADTILFDSYEAAVGSGEMDDSVTPKQFEIAKARMGNLNDGMRTIAHLLADLKGQTLKHCQTGMSLAEYIHFHPERFGQDAKSLETALKDNALQCIDDFAASHGYREACDLLITLVIGNYLDLDDAEWMHQMFSDAQIKRMFEATKRCYAISVASDDRVYEAMPYHLPPSYHLASLNGAHGKEKYGIEPDPVDEFALLLYGAQHGDPNSLGILAHAYAKGNSVSPNRERACYWWQQGMNLELCKACRILNNYEPEESDSYCYACGVIQTEFAKCSEEPGDAGAAP